MAFAYCLNTSTIRNDAITLSDAIDVAAAAGFHGLEPWAAEIDAWKTGGGLIRDLRNKALDHNLEMVNLIAFFEWSVPERGRRCAGLEEARRCFELADALDCSFVAAAPFGIQDRREDLFAVAQRYGELLDAVADFRARPLLEFWGIARTLGTIGEALLVAAECGRSGTRILADIYHIFRGSGHFHGLEHLGPQKLGLVHVNDYPHYLRKDQLTDADRVYPGDGVAPWPQLSKALNRVDYDGMLSLELFNPVYWEKGPAVIAEEGLAKLRTCVE